MSSRNGDPSAAPPSPPEPRWSIAGRLTAHYALSAFLLLNIAAALLYWGLTSILNRQTLRYLDDEINIIRNVLLASPQVEVVRQKLEVGYSAREFLRTYGRVVDAEGNIVAETPLMASLLPSSAFPAPPGDSEYSLAGGKNGEVKKTFLLRSVALEDPVRGRELLQIAFETTHVTSILDQYRMILFMTLVVGTVVSAGIASVIVRRGMRPVADLAARTRSITASNLNGRIGLEQWPREMQGLAGALDEMLDRLQESFERLSGYVSNMAHELRTPINILLGEAEVVLSQARDAEDYRRVLESSVEEYHRLSRTIDSLLFIARSDMRESPLDLEEIETCQEIQQLLEYYLPIVEDKEIGVSCNADALLVADRTLFRRAVSNILSNAVTYTIHGGVISATARKTAGGGVDVVIADSGCGIAPEDLPRISDRFYRAEGTRFLNPQGSGLGLSIVKSIMALHGGTVAITSEVGRGTTVTLHFPPGRGSSPENQSFG